MATIATILLNLEKRLLRIEQKLGIVPAKEELVQPKAYRQMLADEVPKPIAVKEEGDK